jgi:SpoIID/LytB domain protein
VLSAAALLTAIAAVEFWPGGPAPAAPPWVIKGRGWGHGVGMSQWGAYGYARHDRGWRWILAHYYRHTRIGHTGSHRVRVLLASENPSPRFSGADSACGVALDPSLRYRFTLEAGDVHLNRAGGADLTDCGRAGVASGPGPLHLEGKGDYRGRLRAVPSPNGSLLVLNELQLETYLRGVVPSEVKASWPQAALRTEAVAARSWAVVTLRHRPYLFDDARSQLYGGVDAEARASDRAVRRTSHDVAAYRGAIATTYYTASSGGRTEDAQYGFPNEPPEPYLESVRDRFDGISPYHSWTVRYSESQMASKLNGLFSGQLLRIDVLKRGVSPRIVRARIVGSSGSSTVSGLTLAVRLDLLSAWAHIHAP